MLKSVSLNKISDRELGDNKVDYPSNTSMKRFPYVDWKLFIKYNIKDVLLQFGIEEKCDDVLTYYIKSHENLTPYNKIFRETHLLRNVREKYFNKDGWVQNNNINIINNDADDVWDNISNDDDDDEDKSTFKGAIMADPLYNAKIGLNILGFPSNVIYRNLMDYDMGAFYPTLKIISNMDPATLLFNASFINDEFISGEFSNKSLNNTYFEKDKNGKTRANNITGEAINTLASRNTLTFGYNHLNLQSIPELARDVLKELRK